MKKKIVIEGMSCGHCVKHVKDALNEIEGVTNVGVDLDTKTAMVESITDLQDHTIKNIIEEVGYAVVKIETI